ncbi:hypothetical protein GLO38_02825 [Escherichia coli]|uniref:hypothetical protein n=3 Tax=Escherichia coli TaxID=562 RepID=UPI002AC4D18D|nr:hypothetical protein [Escherichia coli]MDZ4926192.1 hypothetical protein [Escherichia coli]MDZ4958003.1 hypothetical protein [Escherichia coli]
MFSNNTPDAAAEAIRTLMHALIDIECTAELAQNKGREEYTAFCLECIRYISSRSLDKDKNILIADCENGGVMRDDRFNSLKQEFSGVSDNAADALSSMPELIRAAFFFLCTDEHRDTGLNILDIAANYADFVTETVLRKTTGGD